MKYDVRLEQLGSRPIAVVRRRAVARDLAKVVPDACGTVWGVLRAQQVTGAGRHVAVYLDNQINLEVGVELDGPFAGYGEVVVSATPAGPVATTTHFGPYGLLHEAHEAIRLWCRNSGHRWPVPTGRFTATGEMNGTMTLPRFARRSFTYWSRTSLRGWMPRRGEARPSCDST